MSIILPHFVKVFLACFIFSCWLILGWILIKKCWNNWPHESLVLSFFVFFKIGLIRLKENVLKIIPYFATVPLVITGHCMYFKFQRLGGYKVFWRQKYIVLCSYEKELFCDFPGNSIIQCELIFWKYILIFCNITFYTKQFWLEYLFYFAYFVLK